MTRGKTRELEKSYLYNVRNRTKYTVKYYWNKKALSTNAVT